MTRKRFTAFAGVYGSVVLGLTSSLVVFRVLGPRGAGRFSIVLGVTDFVALLVWLTSDVSVDVALTVFVDFFATA